MPQPRLSALTIYPIKSCAGISLAQARVTLRGLEHDRRWLIVDAQGVFRTQRKFPQMALVQPRLDGTRLVLSVPEQPEQELPLVPDSGRSERVRVWQDTVEAWQVSDEADQWISGAVGEESRLVWMPESTFREVDPEVAPQRHPVSFADGFPLLAISEASLGDLNTRLAEPVPMRRFRPNVVLAETEPFAEDTWRKVHIGELSFYGGEPCGRCVLTTVDPDSGILAGPEPLRTLATYRRRQGEVLFGQNWIPASEGRLEVGMAVVPAP